MMHVQATLAPVVARCAALLGDTHASFPYGADTAFAALLDVLKFSNDVLSGPGKLAVNALIEASMRAAFYRLVAMASKLDTLAKHAAALLETELAQFTPILELFDPAAGAIASAAVLSLFVEHVGLFLAAKPSEPDALAGLLAAEDFLAKHGGIALLDCSSLAEPFALAWVDKRLAQLRQWAARNLGGERWLPATHSTVLSSFSAVESARFIDATLEDWHALKVQQATATNRLFSGICDLLADYACSVRKLPGDYVSLLPVPPALVRYKKVAVDILIAERKKEKATLRPAVQTACTVDQLLTMLASVDLLLRELPPMTETVLRKWGMLSQRQHALRRGTQDALLLDTHFFPRAEAQLQNARTVVQAHICHQIAFVHCRSTFMEQTYAFGITEQTRLPATLLEPLNAWLERICNRLTDAERCTFLESMMKVVVVGIRHVLLDGGPMRFWSLDEAGVVAEDVAGKCLTGSYSIVGALTLVHNLQSAFASSWQMAQVFRRLVQRPHLRLCAAS
jgi:hypothetical protein